MHGARAGGLMERPILFSGPMVCALLAGTKTQTRRIVKHRGEMDQRDDGGWWPYRMSWSPGDPDGSEWMPCPYGQPGDHLWVRETHMLESNYGLDNEANYPPPFKDGRPIKRESSPDWGDWWTQAHYAATDPKPELCKADDDDRMAGWRPSIHMSRWASRITLEITGVRVERLQQISEADAKAEGAEEGVRCNGLTSATGLRLAELGLSGLSRFRLGYAWLWESINGPGSWDASPWVWVVEFRRIA
jgi:hypothetical protein